MQLFLKIISGLVNSVDPDQTAPSLHCLHLQICQDLDVQNFRTFTVPFISKNLKEFIILPVDVYKI